METKSKKGGKRPGAGRKKTVTGRYFGFNSTAEVQAILDNLPTGTSRSAVINRAIIYYVSEHPNFD